MPIHAQLANVAFETPQDPTQTPPVSVLSFPELCSPEGLGMMVGVGSAFPAPWIWVLGLSSVLMLLLDPELELDVPSTSDVPCSRCHLNSLSFLSPPRSSPASTWGISVVSVFPCPSMVLWDPGVAGRAGGFPLLGSSLCSQLGTSVSSRDPELPQIPIPIASDLTPA